MDLTLDLTLELPSELRMEPQRPKPPLRASGATIAIAVCIAASTAKAIAVITAIADSGGRAWRCGGQAMARIRAFSRDLCRAALFLCRSFLSAIRSIMGMATLYAACAADLSPASIALRTFLSSVRIMERIPTFSSRRRLFWRARLRACGELATGPPGFLRNTSSRKVYRVTAISQLNQQTEQTTSKRLSGQRSARAFVAVKSDDSRLGR